MSFVIPFTVIMAGIIAVFFWAFSGRKKALIEASQQAQAEAAAAAAAPARGRVKWSAAAAANAEQDEDEVTDGQPTASLTLLSPLYFCNILRRHAKSIADEEAADQNAARRRGIAAT